MNTFNEVEMKEAMRDREVMRLIEVSRSNGQESLLDAALEGREKSPASVAKLFTFVRKNIGEGNATNKFWNAAAPFLISSGWSAEQLDKLRHPSPAPGTPGFRSILDEMHDEGRD
jgi:hypothetical protein